ncbi:carbohydrate esterase family 1 protein [Nemania sp. FL0916]|nr:carbohydrate esterase family 1 protein [Nemania sp. FL0916]
MQTLAYLAVGISALLASTVAAGATPGCGKTHLFPGLTTYHGLTSSGHDRTYSVHLPTGYDKATPYPAVIGFHGSSSIGLFFEVDTRLSESRFSANKIMVYPDGVGGAWAGANYSEISVPEDLQFVNDLLAELKSEYCLDDARIYATGISNGGGFVNTIACNAVGGEFAAFAPASGAYYTDDSGAFAENCKPARSPLPVLAIHGGSDTTVPYAGDATRPAIPTWLGWWAERNACTASKVEDSFDGDVHHTTWTCGMEGVLQHWKVDDMGHCWASTEINFSQLSVPQGPTPIEASQIIVDFFDQFTKP